MYFSVPWSIHWHVNLHGHAQDIAKLPSPAARTILRHEIHRNLRIGVQLASAEPCGFPRRCCGGMKWPWRLHVRLHVPRQRGCRHSRVNQYPATWTAESVAISVCRMVTEGSIHFWFMDIHGTMPGRQRLGFCPASSDADDAGRIMPCFHVDGCQLAPARR